MRNKINVMSRQPEITDEELERFKNFDSLLNKHYRILNEKKPVAWKIIVPSLVLIGSVVLYLVLSKNDSKSVENRLSATDSVVLPDKKNDVNVQTESIEAENKKGDSQERKKSNISKTESQNVQSLIESKTDSVITVESETDTTPAVQPEHVPDSQHKPETVYVRAEPIDGYEALYAYFSKELIYPEAAVKDSIEGVLIVKFLINREGKPEKIQTSGTLGVLFDKEAVRLVEHMPLWKPATLNGKPITSKLSLPLTFQLRNRKQP
jgi:TonB family protein